MKYRTSGDFEFELKDGVLFCCYWEAEGFGPHNWSFVDFRCKCVLAITCDYGQEVTVQLGDAVDVEADDPTLWSIVGDGLHQQVSGKFAECVPCED